MLKRRLKNLYLKANYEQIYQGHNWYEDAHFKAVELAIKHKVKLFQAVGVIAALSPSNKWERNLIDADLFLKTPSLETKVCTFFGQREKALAILQAEDFDQVIDILGGTKTQNFAFNILYYHESKSVTVDLWMYRAAKLDPSSKNYQAIEEAISIAADELNILPHQFQAVVWSVVRG